MDENTYDEPLAGAEPVELVEVDEAPSAEAGPAHGEWVDADPDDPAFSNDQDGGCLRWPS